MHLTEIAGFKRPRRSAGQEGRAGDDRKGGRCYEAASPIVDSAMVSDGGPHAPADQHCNIDEREIRT